MEMFEEEYSAAPLSARSVLRPVSSVMSYLPSRFRTLHSQYMLLGSSEDEPFPQARRKRRKFTLALAVLVLASAVFNIVSLVKLTKSTNPPRPLDDFQNLYVPPAFPSAPSTTNPNSPAIPPI